MEQEELQTDFNGEVDYAVSELAGYIKEVGPQASEVMLKPSATGEWAWRVYRRGAEEYDGGVINVRSS